MKRSSRMMIPLLMIIGLVSVSGEDKKPAAPASADVQGGHYHLATAKTYNIQSHDHVRLLQKYAAADGKIPGDVVQEHVSAIRYNTEGAKKAVNRLAKADPGNQALAQQVQQMQQRYDKLNALLKQLEAQVQKNAADEKAVLAGSQAISQQLRDNHVQYQTIDNNFYNSRSDSYYSTGEGHFVD